MGRPRAPGVRVDLKLYPSPWRSGEIWRSEEARLKREISLVGRAGHTMTGLGGSPRRRELVFLGHNMTNAAPNGEFQTADGLLMIATGSQGQFVPLCQAIGMNELLDDPRFATGASRYANDQVLIELMNQRLQTQSRAYWAERLDAAGVPNAPLQDLAQAVEHEQTTASGILQTSPDGNYRVVGLPLKFDGVRPAFRRPAPKLGEADEELL